MARLLLVLALSLTLLPSQSLRASRPARRIQLGRLAVESDVQAVSEESRRAREVADAKEALCLSMSSLFMGFRASAEDKRTVSDAIRKLLSVASEEDIVTDLNGKWELLYSDAPDILGIRGGPLAKLEFIGQDIDSLAMTIDNVIRYSPSDAMRSAFGSLGIANDRLEQRVLLSYEQDPMEPRTVTMRVRGTSIAPENTLGGRLNLNPLELVGPTTLPFGQFEILYNDGDLRIVKTGRGSYGFAERGRLGADRPVKVEVEPAACGQRRGAAAHDEGLTLEATDAARRCPPRFAPPPRGTPSQAIPVAFISLSL
eukprot:scaffold1144_cov215-Pinguiococcus_pyrenoidosus.AAC.5